tara:strand:- start:9979 stop:12030 length:2052 start_codon:yes stop_codon:yes gene_type:complete
MKISEKNLTINELINLYQKKAYKDVIKESKKTISSGNNNWKLFNILGSALLSNDNNEEAIKIFNDTIERFPEIPDLHHNLGICYKISNLYDQAIFEFTEALKYKKDYTEAKISLADTYLILKDYRKSIDIYSELVKAKENNLSIYFNLSKCFEEIGEINQAINTLKLSLKIKNTSEAFYNIGVLLESSNEEEAISYYNNSIKINSNFFQAYLNIYSLFEKKGKYDVLLKISNFLIKNFQDNFNSYFLHGLSLQKNDDLEGSIIFYKKSLELNEFHINTYNNLGSAYLDLKQVNKALALFEKVIKLDECDYETKYNYAKVLTRLNEKEKAKKILEDSIRKDPYPIRGYNILSKVKKIKPDSIEFKKMNELFNKARDNDDEKIFLGLNIGNIHENAKDYSNAASFYIKSNNIKKNSLNYEVSNHIKQFKEIIKLFSLDFKEKHFNKGYKSKKNIFIVGMPRSGSTLIEQILSSHSKVDGLGELKDMAKILNLHNKKYKNFNDLDNIESSYFKKIGKEYFQNIDKKYSPKDIFTDKSLMISQIGFLRLSLPKSKIIYCNRNAKDQTLSIFKNFFQSNNHPYAYNFDDLRKYYNGYKEIMDHWMKIFKNEIYEIKYEDMINNPKESIKKLLKYCELDWEEDCLFFYKNKRMVDTISTSQVRKPFYKNSIGLWKNYQNEFNTLFNGLK